MFGSLAKCCVTCSFFASTVILVAAQLETRAAIHISQEPSWIAVGDFNRDGKPDLVVVGFQPGTNQVSILLGKGDGTFQVPVNYTVGDAPNAPAVADLNNDGKLDLVVPNRLGSSVSVLLGKGDGTFQPAMTFTVPLEATYVAVGDVNNDGKADLVVRDDSGISVLLGNGDGTFQPAITTLPPGPFTAIGIGDWNGDGILDVVTAGQRGVTSEVGVLFGNGDGTFTPGATYPIDNEPVSVAVADFNGDGKLDIAVADSQGIGVAVLLGNGDGTFQPAVFYSTFFPGWIVAADVNGDGKPDLLVAGAGPNLAGAVTVFLGNGDGSFKPGIAYPAGGSSLAVGDFNGDTLLDVASADGRASVTILLNTGAVSFSPPTPLAFASQLVGSASAARSVTLTNNGATTLSIASMTLKGPFQLSGKTTCAGSIAPGASCTIAATFHPTVKGTVGGLVSIADSASSKPQIIQLTGAGTVVSITPQQLNFGSQKVGTKSAPQTATLQNHGSTVLNITSIATPPDYQHTSTCGKQVAPGASCTITITFDPTQTGTRNGSCQITDDGGASPQKLQLTGTGT
jgi:hypothetical protein